MSDLLSQSRLETGVPIETTIVTRDGTRLCVRQHGSDNAPQTVVLLHGLCLDKDSWSSLASELSRRHDDARVISYDHRGHGKSGSSSMRSYRIETLATDLADVLIAKKVSSPLTLVGHSMGGFTILSYLGMFEAERPVDPEAIVLVATAAGKVSERGLGRLLLTPAVDAFCALVGHVPNRIADVLARAMAAPVCKVMLAQIGYGVNYDAALAAVAAGSINDTKLATKAGFLAAIHDYNCYSVLPFVTARTAIISGGKDLLTPKIHSDEMASLIAGALHSHHADAGHMIMHEAPESVLESIEQSISVTKVSA
ncbi:MAG: alpha/beta hydrolase [Spirochaetes bacterium]|nr:MAG: alpha/beta hydrolase [Spirochaetota bacterium]